MSKQGPKQAITPKGTVPGKGAVPPNPPQGKAGPAGGKIASPPGKAGTPGGKIGGPGGKQIQPSVRVQSPKSQSSQAVPQEVNPSPVQSPLPQKSQTVPQEVSPSPVQPSPQPSQTVQLPLPQKSQTVQLPLPQKSQTVQSPPLPGGKIGTQAPLPQKSQTVQSPPLPGGKIGTQPQPPGIKPNMPPPPGTKTNVLPPPGTKTNVPLPGIKPNVPPSRDQLPADSESKPPPEEKKPDENTKKMMKEDGIKNWEKAVDDFKSNLQGWTTSYPTLKDSFIKNIKDNKGEVPAEDVRESVLKAHILLFRCMFERMVAFWRFMPSKKQMKRLETIKDEIQQIDMDNLKEQLKKKRHSVYQEYEKICAHYQEFVKMIQDKYEGKILFFVEDTTESESPDYYMFDAAQSLIALHPLF